jgi:succinate-semialdehyde dehydrogenase/glutarate-semialdehyde dehydrogenase
MALVEPIESAQVGAPGSADSTYRRLRLSNPATLEPIGEIEVMTAWQVEGVVERARKAQPAWAELSCDERGHFLRRAVRVLLDRQEHFLDVIVGETGKPRIEALAAELLPSCDALEFYAKRSGRMLADRSVPAHLARHKKLKVVYRPMGVVGIITPWNFPFMLSINPTIQALMAGNTVVLKVSEATPFTGRLLRELFEAAGLPDGVFNLVEGDGETGAALVESAVDKISFTGSVRTGRKVGEACGRLLKPCTLELGGKDPMIVCADADLERAANGAVWGAFANAGQVCMSTERVFVVEAVADEFIDKVLQKTAQLRQGHEGEFDVGPIIWAPQLEVIEAHVADALERGAELRAGGRRNPSQRGFYYEPTVLTGVHPEMAVMRDETFGPVLPIMRVADEAEALSLANDSRYGLNANIWTRNRHRGEELARALESGCVAVNDCMVNYLIAESPFGGVKDSGIGRVNGELGLKGYCQTQSIVVDRFGGRREALWFPYEAKKQRWVKKVMNFVWGTSLGRFLS